MTLQTDVVVIGAGHAGCEAAYAAARLGCDVLLLGMNLDTVAQMSCNPAIGGLAKGQLVREIDALGGLMALAADATGIQFRMLNTSKGPAVQSPRAQSDKHAYQTWVRHFLENVPRLRLLQDRVLEIMAEGGDVTGVRTALGLEIACRAVIVCTGTFPRGRTHVGSSIAPGGRYGEPAAMEISDSLTALGLPLLRLKTGTCPRVNARSVDTSRMTIQPGDEPPRPFSFLTERLEVDQIPCWSTWTGEATRDAVMAVMDKAPLFSGQIEGIGPRYCPSFELKLVRFPDKIQHHIYVEPEGRATNEMYLNGLSTSIDPDAQVKMVRSVPGLEEAEITRYGYAVEYDAVASRALRETFETKAVRGLYTAGQINGTSGYEEAAAQGLYAGANAALAVQGRPPFLLRRDQAYIGVLVDDLVTRGTDEPYRLFTSRAEHRLLIRQDNADLRLTPLAHELGLVDDDRAARVADLGREVETTRRALESRFFSGRSYAQLLRRPEVSWADVVRMDEERRAAARPSPSSTETEADCAAPSLFGEQSERPQALTGAGLPLPAGEGRGEGSESAEAPGELALTDVSPRAAEQLEIEILYEGYLQRHAAQIEAVRKAAEVRIPAGFDYRAVKGLSNEAREKLLAIQPETLGQAGRISGVSPSDLAVLTLRLRG